MTEPVDQFWDAYVATLPEGTPRPHYAEAWSFGDTTAMADELGALVLQGVKTATAGLVWEYEAAGDSLPQAGTYIVILNGAQEPLCIVQSTRVDIVPFDEVSAEFAALEGEGDRSLTSWREVHWQYFSRVCARVGHSPDPTMPVVCHRFQVVRR